MSALVFFDLLAARLQALQLAPQAHLWMPGALAENAGRDHA